MYQTGCDCTIDQREGVVTCTKLVVTVPLISGRVLLPAGLNWYTLEREPLTEPSSDS